MSANKIRIRNKYTVSDWDPKKMLLITCSLKRRIITWKTGITGLFRKSLPFVRIISR